MYRERDLVSELVFQSVQLYLPRSVGTQEFSPVRNVNPNGPPPTGWKFYGRPILVIDRPANGDMIQFVTLTTLGGQSIYGLPKDQQDWYLTTQPYEDHPLQGNKPCYVPLKYEHGCPKDVRSLIQITHVWEMPWKCAEQYFPDRALDTGASIATIFTSCSFKYVQCALLEKHDWLRSMKCGPPSIPSAISCAKNGKSPRPVQPPKTEPMGATPSQSTKPVSTSSSKSTEAIPLAASRASQSTTSVTLSKAPDQIGSSHTHYSSQSRGEDVPSTQEKSSSSTPSETESAQAAVLKTPPSSTASDAFTAPLSTPKTPVATPTSESMAEDTNSNPESDTKPTYINKSWKLEYHGGFLHYAISRIEILVSRGENWTDIPVPLPAKIQPGFSLTMNSPLGDENDVHANAQSDSPDSTREQDEEGFHDYASVMLKRTVCELILALRLHGGWQIESVFASRGQISS